MASGSLTVAALRHRPRQAVLLIVLAAVVSASATLGPLYARATEQSVLRNVLLAAPVAARGVVVTSSTNKPPSPQLLSRAVARTPGFGRPIGGAESRVTVHGVASAGGTVDGAARLTSRDGLCRHLAIVTGTCADATAGVGAVIVSQRNAAAFDISVGDNLELIDSDDSKVALQASVVGVYRAFDAASDYWFGRSANAVIPPPRQGEPTPIALDTIYASWPTVHSVMFTQLVTHADVPLRVNDIDLTGLGALRDGARSIGARTHTVGASSVTGLADLIATSDDQRRQTHTVIPLLAIQLAVLGVVVLAFVCAAATEARRPEIALARLRGQGSTGAAGLLVRELGLLIVIGTTAGAFAGWLVARFAAARWLAPGVHIELRWPVLAAIAAATVAGVLAVLVTAAPTLRQPLVSLLRRVPPRASSLQAGLIEGALIAAAIAGEVTLLTSKKVPSGGAVVGSQSPVSLLAPGLLAVAGGLLLAQLVVPAASPLARRALRRGHVSSALASTQVARRPALRRLISIITVACALFIFAVDVWEVADRNRDARAAVEGGAPVVLTVNASNAGDLRSAVLQIDPRQRFATPVVTASSAGEGGPRTTAVEPAAFARIARWGGVTRTPSRAMMRKLGATTVAPVQLTGRRLRMEIDATYRGVGEDLTSRGPPPGPPSVLLHLVDVRDGRSIDVEPSTRLRQGSNTLEAAMPCTSGCLLRTVEVRRDIRDAVGGIKIRLRIRQILTSSPGETTTAVDLGPVSVAAWQPVPNDNGDEVTVDPRQPISFTDDTFGSFMAVQRGDVAVVAPALIAGDVLDHVFGPTFPDPALAPDLTGIDATYDVTGRITQVPRTGAKGVLVNLALMDKTVPPTTQTSYAVWLAADDPRQERRLVSDLQRRGILVTARDSIHDHQVALAGEGPAQALRLALLAGVVSLVLAAFVLVVGVATSSESRARDLAGLRVVGVPARVVRAAAIREHVTVAVLGTVAGVSLGLAAAQAALPRLPLFAEPGARLPVNYSPAWSAVAISATTCLVVLVLVSVFVGRALAASATPDRLRQDR